MSQGTFSSHNIALTSSYQPELKSELQNSDSSGDWHRTKMNNSNLPFIIILSLLQTYCKISLMESFYRLFINSIIEGCRIIQNNWEHVKFKTVAPARVDVRRSGELRLTCSATGSPAPSVAWYKGDLFVAHLEDDNQYKAETSLGETVARLTLPCMSVKDVGQYECRASAGRQQISAVTQVSHLIFIWVKTFHLTYYFLRIVYMYVLKIHSSGQCCWLGHKPLSVPGATWTGNRNVENHSDGWDRAQYCAPLSRVLRGQHHVDRQQWQYCIRWQTRGIGIWRLDDPSRDLGWHGRIQVFSLQWQWLWCCQDLPLSLGNWPKYKLRREVKLCSKWPRELCYSRNTETWFLPWNFRKSKTESNGL